MFPRELHGLIQPGVQLSLLLESLVSAPKWTSLWSVCSWAGEPENREKGFTQLSVAGCKTDVFVFFCLINIIQVAQFDRWYLTFNLTPKAVTIYQKSWPFVEWPVWLRSVPQERKEGNGWEQYVGEHRWCLQRVWIYVSICLLILERQSERVSKWVGRGGGAERERES